MGLHTWTHAPHAKIQKFDVIVAKNYHRVVQDRLFESGFDRVVAETKRLAEGVPSSTPR